MTYLFALPALALIFVSIKRPAIVTRILTGATIGAFIALFCAVWLVSDGAIASPRGYSSQPMTPAPWPSTLSALDL